MLEKDTEEHNVSVEHGRNVYKSLEDLLIKLNEEPVIQQMVDFLSKQENSYKKAMSSITKLRYCVYVIYVALTIFLATFIYNQTQISVETKRYEDPWPSFQ